MTEGCPDMSSVRRAPTWHASTDIYLPQHLSLPYIEVAVSYNATLTCEAPVLPLLYCTPFISHHSTVHPTTLYYLMEFGSLRIKPL